MKKILIPLIVCCLIAKASVAQIAINTDGSPADSSAMLDVKSTTKGLLVPRLTSVQRLAISNAADGLFVYDSVAKQLYYYQRGFGWQQLLNSNGTFTLPYTGTVSSPSTAFSIKNTGGGDALDGLITSSSGTPTAAVSGRNDGPGYGTYGFAATDTSGTGIGVLGQSGVNGGKGIAAHFENLNASNAANTLEAVTNGLGIVASFVSNNSSDTANTLNVVTNTGGNANNPRVGNGGNFFVNNTTSIGAGVRGEVSTIYSNPGAAGVYGSSSGTGGFGGYFDQTNANGYGMALKAAQYGMGTAGHFENYSTTNSNNVLEAQADGLGNAGSFYINNSANNSNALYASTTGLGSVANFVLNNPSSFANALSVTTNDNGNINGEGGGNAGYFFVNNTNGIGAGVFGQVNSSNLFNGTAGISGLASGTGGYGGYFQVSNSMGLGTALYAETNGLGSAANFILNNASDSADALSVISATVGNKGNSRFGNAGNFFNDNIYGNGAGVRGEVNSQSISPGTAGVYGSASGTGGYGGYFDATNASGNAIALNAVSDNQAPAFVANTAQGGFSGYIAWFENGGNIVAGVTRSGQGFFQGGVANGGADLAETFDVEGQYSDYEPGDVLEISPSSDRTLVKSSTPYSTLVAGVYATKPGVLLTEDSISAAHAGKVPLGVVGVIPTKVCNENGPIARGDMLVTSSRPGYAMKADMNKAKLGQVLGKALQAFNGETGKIKVLVSVK